MIEDSDESRVFAWLIIILGQEIMFLDMPKAHHAPEFSWANSIYIDC